MYVCMHVCMCVFTSIYTYIHVCMLSNYLIIVYYVYDTHASMHVCSFVCIYIYTHHSMSHLENVGSISTFGILVSWTETSWIPTAQSPARPPQELRWRARSEAPAGCTGGQLYLADAGPPDDMIYDPKGKTETNRRCRLSSGGGIRIEKRNHKSKDPLQRPMICGSCLVVSWSYK